MPLNISTTAEACAWLEDQTGHAWQESELFDAAIKWGVTMCAAPPLTARASEQELVTPMDLTRYPTGFRKLTTVGWKMARLYPCHIFQIWTLGETETIHAACEPINDHYKVWFDDPVRVTREQLRIGAASLEKLLTKYNRFRALCARPGIDGQSVSAPAAQGVPSKTIIDKFGLDSAWIEKLKRQNRSQDYDRARMAKGGRSPGKSHTWNPAIFGALLVTNYVSGYSTERIGVIIKNHFEKWLDEWDAELQDIA